MVYELGFGIAKSLFLLAIIAVWKIPFHISSEILSAIYSIARYRVWALNFLLRLRAADSSLSISNIGSSMTTLLHIASLTSVTK